MAEIKLPPHDLEAEEATLGSLLIDPNAMTKIATWLHAYDFYREKNQWIYEACIKLHGRGEPTNQIIVAHEMARSQRLEAMGGAAYLSHLISQVPTSIHVEYYARIVQRLSFMRRLIIAANQIIAVAYDQPPTIEEALGFVDEIIAKLKSDLKLRSKSTSRAIDLDHVTRE